MHYFKELIIQDSDMQELANEFFLQLSENERRTMKLPPYEPTAIPQYISKVFKHIYGLKTIYQLKLTDLEKRFDEELQIKLQQFKNQHLMRESELKVQISKLQLLLEQSVMKFISLPHSDKLSPRQKKLKSQNFFFQQFLLKIKKIEEKKTEEISPINNRLKRSRSSITEDLENYNKSQQFHELIRINNSKESFDGSQEIKDQEFKFSQKHLETNQNHKLNRYPHQSMFGRKKILNLQRVQTEESQSTFDLSSKLLISDSLSKSTLHFSELL